MLVHSERDGIIAFRAEHALAIRTLWRLASGMQMLQRTCNQEGQLIVLQHWNRRVLAWQQQARCGVMLLQARLRRCSDQMQGDGRSRQMDAVKEVSVIVLLTMPATAIGMLQHVLFHCDEGFRCSCGHFHQLTASKIL